MKLTMRLPVCYDKLRVTVSKQVCLIQINLNHLYGTKTFILLELYKGDLLGGS